MYSFIGHIPIASNASTNNYQYHPSYLILQAEITSILWANRWWNSSSTFNITSMTNQLLLLYINILWTTALYIIACDRTVATVFVSTFVTTPQCCCTLLIFLYRTAYLLLSNATLKLKYGKAAVDSSGSRLTRIVTLIASK